MAASIKHLPSCGDFARVFTKYLTNTKMLLSDALIFQGKSIRQPLLDSTMAAHQNAGTKQALTGAAVAMCELEIQRLEVRRVNDLTHMPRKL